MALGLAVAEANALLTAHTGGTAYSGPAEWWLQLHVADPGAAGTTAPAANATRKLIAWSAAAGGIRANSGLITWTTGEVTTNEDYSHLTAWSESTGTVRFLASGLMVADAIITPTEFQIPIGSLTLQLPIAA